MAEIIEVKNNRPALRVLAKILKDICSHHSFDYKYECPKWLAEFLDKEENQEAHAKFLIMVLTIRQKQREGDEKLLKAIFGMDEETEVDCDEDEELDDDDTDDFDYKERVAREYWDLTEKHNKLTKFLEDYAKGKVKGFKGSIDLLKHQEHQMYEYLQTLQKRAVVENIELGKYKENK